MLFAITVLMYVTHFGLLFYLLYIAKQYIQESNDYVKKLTPPTRNDPANFSERADTFLVALSEFSKKAKKQYNI